MEVMFVAMDPLGWIREIIVSIALVLMVHHCGRCSSQPLYDDGETRRSLYSCEANWCKQTWEDNRILRYNYSYSESIVMKSVKVIEKKHDCTGVINSLDCAPSSSESDTILQIPMVVRILNRTGPSIENDPEELSLGFIRTDNVGMWGNLLFERYPSNQDKIWQIGIPQTAEGTCRIIIYFNEFDIDQSSNCEKDYFSVQTNKLQTDIPKYCNTLSRIEIRNRKRLQLWMHSESAPSGRGIHAIYCFSHWPARLSDLPCSCGMDISSVTNRIRRNTPGHDGDDQQTEINTQTDKEEDHEVHQWLRDILTHGEYKLTEYLNSHDQKQRHIARQLAKAVQRHK